MAENKWNDLSNQNVWENQTAFDAEKWKDAGPATIKLLSVSFDAKYEHVVDWKSDEDRNAWFEEQDGYEVELKTGWNLKTLEVFNGGAQRRQGSVKISIPYEAATNYNYVYIKTYDPPVPGDEDNRRFNYFYFLTSLIKHAASTTELTLELDTWTAYKNSVNIEAVNLKRGHYPHANIDADAFLSNPLDNTFGINDPEVDLPTLKTKVSHSDFVSLSKSSPRILIATTGNFKDIFSWRTAVPTLSRPNPDLAPLPKWDSDTPANSRLKWWNKNLFTVGFSQDDEGKEIFDPFAIHRIPSNARQIASVAQQKNGKGSTESLRVYSIAPTDFSRFINLRRAENISVLRSIKAIFVLDSSLIDESDEFEFMGYSFKEVNQQSDPKLIKDININKEMFNYTEDEADFAKLYTSQFAHIEISNLQGQKAEVSIEEIAQKLSVYARSSTLFPFLKLETLIDGIGGQGFNSFKIKPLDSMDTKVLSGNWESFTMEYDIPTYSIYAAKDQVINQENFMKKRAAALDAGNKFNKNIQTINTASTILRNDINLNYFLGNERNIKDHDSAVRGYELAREIDMINVNKSFSNNYSLNSASYNTASISATNSRQNDAESVDRAYSNAIDSLSVRKLISDRTANSDFNLRTASIDLDYEVARSRNHIDVDFFIEERALKRQLLNNERELNESTYDSLWRVRFDTYIESLNNARASTQLNLNADLKLHFWAIVSAGVAAIPAIAGAGGIAYVSSQISANRQPASTTNSQKAGAPPAKTTAPGSTSSSRVKTAWSKVNTPSMGIFTIGAVTGIAGSLLNSLANQEANEISRDLVFKQSIILQGNNAYGSGSFTKATGVLNKLDTSWSGRPSKWIEFTTAEELDFIELDQNIRADRMAFDTEMALRTFITYSSYDLNYRIIDAERAIASNESSVSHSLALVNAASESATSRTVAVRNSTVDYGILNRNFDTANEIRDIDFDVAEEIMTRDRNTESSNINKRRQNAYTDEENRNYYTNLELTEKRKNSREIDRLTLGKDYLLNKKDIAQDEVNWIAESYDSFQGEPIEFADNSGNSWVDQWGQRGLQIQVIRCNDSVAKQAASLFSRYGYRTQNLWIENPTLTLMTDFTYWEVDQVWITGERVNEADKAIFRNLFQTGITIWDTPEAIFNVSITANKKR